MGWLVIGIPVVIGFIFGRLLPVRRALVLLAPAVAIALLYWSASWFGHDYELGKSFYVMLTGGIAAAFVTLWTVGVLLGRLDRGTWRARASSTPSRSLNR
jgi:hypothetical protein